ncbi:MAG: tRNA pseudouridine(55) synthase TruB [Deltaproteobacteria bacterium]|nr:tRNA pseudouridine(55) synthase TruB [Deltaproteobacteria bacterium]
MPAPERETAVRSAEGDGILLVDKASGETSYDVVRKAKRVSGLKKVGHAGTLDPFSTGLLILMLGRGTKLMPFLMERSKQYRAVIHLGIETDTYDPEGRVVEEKPVPELTPGFIHAALERFVGEIEQVPPAFSAVHVDGTRAYKLARRGLDVPLPGRKVVIHGIDLLSLDPPRLSVDVHCSAGTYVRSLAHDLGKELNTGAHLVELRRVASGSFRVEDALESELLSGKGGREHLREHLIPLSKALPDMPMVRIGQAMAARIRNGYQPARAEIPPARRDTNTTGRHVQLLCDGELVAIIETTPNASGGEERTQLIRVFN